jgi:hypothetical protein
MKRWVASVSLLGMIWWSAPTSYTDNTAIPPSVIQTILYRIYVDGTEFATAKGVLQWQGNLPQAAGQTKVYTATAEIDGKPGTRSAKTAPYTFVWEATPTPAPTPVPTPIPAPAAAKMRVRTNPEMNFKCEQVNGPLTFSPGYWKIQKYKQRPELWIEIEK